MNAAVWTVVGIAIGAAIGATTGDIAVWTAIGAGIGAATSFAMRRRPTRPGPS